MVEVRNKTQVGTLLYLIFYKVDSTVGDFEGALNEIKQESSYFQIITRNYKVGRWKKVRFCLINILLPRITLMQFLGSPEKSKILTSLPTKFSPMVLSWILTTLGSLTLSTGQGGRSLLILPSITNSKYYIHG